MKSFPPYSRKAAFTLIELLTVIAIIAILAGLLFAVGGAVRDSTRASRASAEIAAISTALVRFQVDFGFLPEVDFIPIVDDNGLEYAPQNAGNANAYRASSRALYFALQGLGYLPDEIPDGLEQTRRNRSLIDLSPSQFALTDDFSAGAPGPEIVVTLPPGNGGRDDRRIYEFPANFAAGPYLVDPWGFAYGYFLRDERFSPETPNLDQGQVSLHNYDTYDLWSVRDAAANRPSSRWVKNW